METRIARDARELCQNGNGCGGPEAETTDTEWEGTTRDEAMAAEQAVRQAPLVHITGDFNLVNIGAAAQDTPLMLSHGDMTVVFGKPSPETGDSQRFYANMEGDDPMQSTFQAGSMTTASTQQSEFITVKQAAEMSGRTKQAIHKALGRIRHITSRPDTYGRRSILVHEPSFRAWDRAEGRGPKKHMAIDEAS